MERRRSVGEGRGECLRGAAAAAVVSLVCLAAAGMAGCGSSAGGARTGSGTGAVGGWQEGVTGPACKAGSGGVSAPAGGWGGGPGGAGGGTGGGVGEPLPAAPASDARLFRTPFVYVTGGHPSAVATGDLNGDGAPDVAGISANPCGTIAVMLNEGDGHMAAPVFYSGGTHPVSLRLGDLNGDGKLDLAVVDFTGGGVQLLFGDGAGGFGFPINHPTGAQAISLAVGDVNGDRAVDVVTANRNSNTVSVLVNDGGGSFADAVNYPTTAFPQAVTLGDLNGDGRQDLAVVSDAAVSVLLNQGRGTFAARSDYSTQVDGARGLVAAVAADDVDGNGIDDVVVADRGRAEVGVFLSDAAGRLAAPIRYPAAEAQAVEVGDVNGDGRVDLAIGGSNVTVLAGVGDGTFSSGGIYAVSAASVALADLNGDGRPDVAAASSAEDRWTVMLNRGDGMLEGGVIQPAASFAFPMSLSLADMDGDGRPDLTAPGTNGSVVTLLNDGGGSFSTRRDLSYADSFGKDFFVATGDWSGDGLADLAISDSEARTGNGIVTLFRNRGDASFEAAGAYPTETGQGPAVFGDWNGDGRLDLAVANAYRASVSAFINLGDGTFGAADVHPVGEFPRVVAAADLDGDGKSDLAVATEVGKGVSVLLTKGATGTFAPAVNWPGVAVSGVALGDLNGDGYPDMVTGTNRVVADGVSVFLNIGDGTFAMPVVYPAGSVPAGVAVGDLDGDGAPDIAVSGADGVVVLRNAGGGTFSLPVVYAVGSSPIAPLLGDLNGDGATDLALSGRLISVSLNVLGRQ